MKPPAFVSQQQADRWLESAELFQEQAMKAARQVWQAEDGTVIGYNTTSIPRGGFCSFRYRANDGGVPISVVFVKRHARRKDARARAYALYRKYAPKWANRHPDFF